MTRESDSQGTRWVRRDTKKVSERRRPYKHGASFVRAYRMAVIKRARASKKSAN